MTASQLPNVITSKVAPKRLSRSHRAGSPTLYSLDETLKAMPYEKKKKFGSVGSYIFVGILLLLTIAIIVFNYFWFRRSQIDTIDAETKPPAHVVNQ